MRDRTFGPAVLGGLATAALTAVAAAQDWGVATGDNAGVTATGRADGATNGPLAHGEARVALASWGVLLVLRGRLRRDIPEWSQELPSTAPVDYTIVSNGQSSRRTY